MRKTHDIAKNIALFGIILCILVVGLEVAYRVYKHSKYFGEMKKLDDPLIRSLGPKSRLEYVFRKNATFTTGSGVTYETNSRGLRDREFGFKKPKKVYRILTLGDSYTFGWMEALEDSYPKILERLLNHYSRQKYEVINAGIYGYNTEQEYEFLKKYGIKYHPDLVILGFVLNDAEPQNLIPRSPYLEMEGINFWLAEFIKYRLNILIKKLCKRDDFFTISRKEFSFHSWEGFTRKEYAWKKKNCLNAIKNIKRFLDKRNTPLLVVMFPAFEYYDGTIPVYNNGYRYKPVDDAVKDLCKRGDIDFLELYPFYENREAKDIRQESGHLNQKGYHIAAEAIADRIERLLNK